MMEEEASWAEAEFGLAELGDARRTARLVQIASAVGAALIALLALAGCMAPAKESTLLPTPTLIPREITCDEIA
ncbi:MAG: hypothetical protein H0T73_12315, partial [Ardenticatenales bacterium]|nr:hypothetical protein [Ardenticatenales bacterium]